jgi:hypothetical protein
MNKAPPKRGSSRGVEFIDDEVRVKGGKYCARIRCAPDSRHMLHSSEMTRWAKSRPYRGNATRGIIAFD